MPSLPPYPDGQGGCLIGHSPQGILLVSENIEQHQGLECGKPHFRSCLVEDGKPLIRDPNRESFLDFFHGASEVRWVCELQAKGLKKAILPVVAGVLKKEDGEHLEKAKAVLESRAAA